MRFWIRVTPNSKRPGVGGTWDGPAGPALRVNVAAPAVDGKANKAVLAALAAALELRRGQIDIVQGDTSRTKLIEVPASSETEATLDRLRRGGAGEDSPRFVALDGEEASRRRIRGLYQRFLAAMIERERPRPPGATPDGYRAAVAPATPEQAAALERLTAAYVAVRYGASAPDAAAVADADAAWRAIASGQRADDAPHPTS